MKKLLLSAMLAGALQVAFAQNDPGRPIDPVTDQKQNINTMGLDNTQMTQVETAAVPATVSESFTTRYPDQKDVVWYSSNNGYVTVYNDPSGVSQRIAYDKNGKVIYTGRQVKGTNLPPTANTYLTKTYPNTNFDNVYEIKDPNGVTTYEVLVNGRWVKFDDKGNSVYGK